MPGYKIKLMYVPGQSSEAALDIVAKLDAQMFPGCVTEKLKNNMWWLVYDSKDNVVGYAGMQYLEDEDYCYFSRAGILSAHRGKGLHKRLISARIKKAKALESGGVITYVSPQNNASMNSLVGRGFRLYTPARRWAGVEFLYLKLAFGNDE